MFARAPSLRRLVFLLLPLLLRSLLLFLPPRLIARVPLPQYEENRGFDHIFGHNQKLKANGADILKGTESNPRSLTDPSKGRVTVKAGAPYLNLIDPNHGMPAYTLKIFGNKTFNDTSQSPNYVNDAVATMEGFFAYETAHHGNVTEADFVMEGFDPDAIPVTSRLAEEFAVFDRWFAAFPGPSWPNHLFSITGTSAGCTETSDMFQCTRGECSNGRLRLY